MSAPDPRDAELFVVEGEENLLCLKQLGLPGVAVPAAADLEHLDPRRFEWIRTLFLWVGHSAESAALARVFATRAGFKVRIVRWPDNAPKSASLHSLATEQPDGFQQRVFAMVREARAFSPFPSPAGEFHTFTERLAQEAGAGWAGAGPAAGLVAIEYGARGPNFGVVSACATGTHAIGDAANAEVVREQRVA